jgi:hypothetical protein
MALDILAIAAAPAGGGAARWVLAGCGAVLTASLGLYALSPFLALGLPWSYARTLAMVPVFIGWKAIVALGGRPQGWVRTARETRADAAGPVERGGRSTSPADPCQSP